ncbi:MAG: ribonuclease H family protein [Candidatus Sungbacteria bacterium]|nr:ribonuclease H family protein [Candidatus Sungbacteria bacterium]
MAKKYYAYIVPDTGEIGVAENWKECEEKVSGVQGARFKGFSRKEDAENWLADGAKYESHAKKAKYISKALERGIYFDAGTGRGEGLVEAKVTDEKGKSLLSYILSAEEITRFGTYVIRDFSATNNFGELTALRFALEIAKKNNGKKIFGDSKLVIEYWSKGIMKKETLKEETKNLIKKVRALRKDFEEQGGYIAHISGDRNPADLGFHR